MQIITNNVHNNKLLQISSYYNPEDIIIFDIETTGFVAEATKLYMIGCAFYKEGKWMITQWFNDDGNSETDIISLFFEFASHYKYLLHYNGDGFDIPYLTKNASQLNIGYNLDKLVSIDLYKILKPFKDIMHIDNLKQKTLENFIGINRLDKYSGGNLIKIYQEFLMTGNESKKKLLIQHNYEDLEGLMYCCSLLSLTKLKAGCFIIRKMSVKDNRLLFTLSLDYPVPKRISIGVKDILISAYENEATINVPIVSEEMKFFFDNYRDYYYLPAEDMAVHKSVAKYVDRNYRFQAKKENCYQKRTGHFITQLDSGILTGYKRDYKDTETFIELVDSFLQDMDMLISYSRYIIFKCMN